MKAFCPHCGCPGSANLTHGRAPAHMPELMGIGEVAHYLGTTKDAVRDLIRRGEMPDPDWALVDGAIWTKFTIEFWADSTGRS